jgi:hypothetical protein
MTEVKTNAVSLVLKWIKDNYWTLIFSVLFLTGVFSILSSAAEHKNDVQEVSKQNASCIYLESSDLGDGQHYMICDGQIVLKRLSENTDNQPTPEEQLQEVVPTEASNETAKATPPAK